MKSWKLQVQRLPFLKGKILTSVFINFCQLFNIVLTFLFYYCREDNINDNSTRNVQITGTPEAAQSAHLVIIEKLKKVIKNTIIFI